MAIGKMQLDKVITEEDRRMRMPLWGYVFIPVGAFLLSALCDHFGKLALVRPTGSSVSVILVSIHDLKGCARITRYELVRIAVGRVMTISTSQIL
jgi:hypothetical protein